jgi:enterochelin esterase-like enzyme/HSP20 family molecular chaperone IbpA
METTREEAAPTFPTWRRRLEEAPDQQLPEEVDRFLHVLKAVGAPMIDGADVHFIYYGSDARHVALVGEFNQWSPRGIDMTRLQDTGLFYHTMQVRGPARIEYKFIVDGEWVTDPFCPNAIDNGIGEQNSSFVVGDFHEPPELEVNPAIAHGRVEEFDFESKGLNNHRRVYVYLPPSYATEATSQFSTLYVHDGGEYLTRARLATVLDNLIHSGDVVPLIAVMVDPVDRGREYWANEEYACFTEQELVPHIDRRYRTLARREARGVMGASLGGLISTYLALSRPHLFSKVGGQSSALFLLEGDRGSGLGAELRKRIQTLPRHEGEPHSLASLVEKLSTPITFYFDVGKYEPQFIPAHHHLVPLLEAKGCPCFFQELTGGHNWTSWRAHLKDMLTFLWGKEQKLKGTGLASTATTASAQPASGMPWPQWRDLDAVFKRFLRNWEQVVPGWLRSSGWDPTVEISMAGEMLIFKVALSGFAPQDVEVLVVGNQIVIKGRRTTPPEQAQSLSPFAQAHHFERTLPLPEGVSADHIQARAHDGVLELSMPAPRGIATQHIPIEIK